MNLLRSLRRLDDVVLARLGFIQPRRYAAGGLVLSPTTVHLQLGEKIIGPEEMARLVARHLARAKAKGERTL